MVPPFLPPAIIPPSNSTTLQDCTCHLIPPSQLRGVTNQLPASCSSAPSEATASLWFGGRTLCFSQSMLLYVWLNPPVLTDSQSKILFFTVLTVNNSSVLTKPSSVVFKANVNKLSHRGMRMRLATFHIVFIVNKTNPMNRPKPIMCWSHQSQMWFISLYHRTLSLSKN